MRHSAMLAGSTSTKNERAAESIGVITDEIVALAQGEVGADELDKAKSFLTGSYGLRFDTSTKIARELLQVQLNELGIDHFNHRNAEIAAVTAADVSRVSKRLLDPSKMLVVVVGRPVGL
jgi:zinc protease